jgi:hypothetical protein
MSEAFVYLEEGCSTSKHHCNESFFLSNFLVAWANLISSKNLLNCAIHGAYSLVTFSVLSGA